MTLKSCLITNSGINTYTGGGIVSLNLLEVLKSISNVELILSNQHFKDGRYDDIYAQCLDPSQFGYDDPFFYDYFAQSMVDGKDFDIAITYGCPFGETVRFLKNETFCRVICDLAPHNINTSREEHLFYPPNTYPYPHLTNKYLLGLYLKQLRLADKVIVHSNSSAEYIMGEANLEELPEVIPHGCYAPSETPEFTSDFKVGYMGSLGNDKGVRYLIKAVLQIDQTLLLAGRESNSFTIDTKPELFQKLGEVSLHDFYKQISVGVFPSVVEGFGICGLECMSYGRPIITTPGTGVSELITDGKEGFIVPIRDVKGISDKIEYFRDNPSEIERMGREARKTSEKYTWEIIKKQYVDTIMDGWLL